MKTVKTYGPRCKRCEAAEAMIKEAASRLGVEVASERITDARSIPVDANLIF